MNDDDVDVEFQIVTATEEHLRFASLISQTMEESARLRGTGISKRSPQNIACYIQKSEAVVAIHKSGRWAGFTYMAVWDNGKFISNSGLIVAPEFREHGVAKHLKRKLFELSRKKYPHCVVIGITTSAAVMKINSELGFQPTAFSDIAKEDNFWKGCASCVNHDVLERTGRKYCLCTAMRFDPAKNHHIEEASHIPAVINSEEFH